MDAQNLMPYLCQLHKYLVLILISLTVEYGE